MKTSIFTLFYSSTIILYQYQLLNDIPVRWPSTVDPSGHFHYSYAHIYYILFYFHSLLKRELSNLHDTPPCNKVIIRVMYLTFTSNTELGNLAFFPVFSPFFFFFLFHLQGPKTGVTFETYYVAILCMSATIIIIIKQYQQLLCWTTI